MVGNGIIMLTPTAAQEEKNMLETSLNQISLEVPEDDKWVLDAMAEDTNGILAFVSLNLLIRLFIILILNENLEVGSSLHNCCCLYYRVLQNVVRQFWRSNSSPSWTDFTATHKFPKWHIHHCGGSTILSQCIHDLGQRDVAYKPRV
jgi:hypothetical protein